ncbi:hypothetical protein KP509_17G059600 [Ceratopteris richardii]|uniref:Plastid lipid-associated protein/fibrillin conserved domain-containing protein n=1 Tax=Ceratopteris richardii TaxID=49495 RepID=A0A8T2SWK8_CERRI|nr:hypothetical protein KP509_17G059600 [Ceratopteris richardii]
MDTLASSSLRYASPCSPQRSSVLPLTRSTTGFVASRWPDSKLSLSVCPSLRSRVLAVRSDDEWGPEVSENFVRASAVGVAAIHDETAPGNSVTDLKRALVDCLVGTDRGLKASSELRAEIVELITQLEAKNPTPAPMQALPLLQGKWILVYTSFSDLFPFLAAGSFPLVRVGEISQYVDSDALTVENSVTFTGPLASTSVRTSASFEIKSPKRVQIKFEEGVIGTPQITDLIEIPENVQLVGQNVDLKPVQGLLKSLQDAASSVARSLSEQPPLKFPIRIERAQSWLLTTYLDSDLRISRGDAGSIFVFLKEGCELLADN